MAKQMKQVVTGMSIAVLFALTGYAHATSTACPEVASIKQSPGEYGGFDYKVTTADGKKWTGENPMAGEKDLNTLKFKGAYIVSGKEFVACDYEGEGEAAVRMTLEIGKSTVRGTGSAWTSSKNADGAAESHCAGPTATQCSFE